MAAGRAAPLPDKSPERTVREIHSGLKVPEEHRACQKPPKPNNRSTTTTAASANR